MTSFAEDGRWNVAYTISCFCVHSFIDLITLAQSIRSVVNKAHSWAYGQRDYCQDIGNHYIEAAHPSPVDEPLERSLS